MPWDGKPWWRRPVRAIVIGLVAGLAIGYAINVLPEPYNTAALIAFVAGAIGFCLYQLVVTRREMRELADQQDRWERQVRAAFPPQAPRDGGVG